MPFILEVAELVREVHRSEADPDRIHAGDLVGLADRRPRVAHERHSQDECPHSKQGSRQTRLAECPYLSPSRNRSRLQSRLRNLAKVRPVCAALIALALPLVEDVTEEVQKHLRREERGDP